MQTINKTNLDTSNRELVISRTLNAPIQLVWEVWTQPTHIKNWWGPTGFSNTIDTMEFKEGGEWNFVMHGPDGKNYINRIIYIEIIELTLIRYKHVSFPYFNAEIRFTAQGQKTHLEWKMVFDSEEELKNTIKTFKADEGLKENLIKLESYLKQHLISFESK